MSDYLYEATPFTSPIISIEHAAVHPSGGVTTNSVSDPNVVSEVRIYASSGGFSGGASGGGSGGAPEADHPTLEDGGGEPIQVDWSTLTDATKHALCSLSHSVASLDGLFPYGSDGDGMDEFINILTAASYIIGGAGGVSMMLGRVAAGTLTSTAVMEGIATVFGDTIALKVSYGLSPALSSIGTALGITGASGAAFKDLVDALTDGNPPPGCSTGTA